MSDPRDRLRAYLEQRREMGESEFVLDSLSVEDALKVLTAKAKAPDVDWRAALRGVDAGPPAASGKASQAPARPAPKAAPVAARPEPAPDAPAPATQAGGQRVIGAGAATSGLEHLATLDDVRAAIAGCDRCTLAKGAKNHVPGEGNPTARFVVVGEAPGATEDELGKPFVGKSGDLLTKILAAVQFSRDEVFICNVLKHRPPANRNPLREEIVACRPFLLRQLEILRPKVILALGTFAAQTLLETDSPIGKLRGIEHRYHGIPLVATYHPAALLRNPNWKRPAWEDVQLARRIFDRA